MSVNGESVSLKEMLTRCPKCGFSQPKDQYCARCGVDMVAYRPPDKSFGQKLGESLFVQLSLVVLVGVIAVYFITRNQKQSFWSRVQFLHGSTQVASSGDSNQFSREEGQQPQAMMENSEMVAGVEAEREPAETGRNLANRGPQVKIMYLQVPQQVLAKWLEDGFLTRVESSEGITIGYIPQLTKVLEQYRNQVKVVKEDQYPYALNQLYTAKLESASPAADTNAARNVASQPDGATAIPATVMAYATLDDDRNETLTGQLEVSLNPQTSFPAQFEMTPDQSFFISGFNRAQQPEKATLSETVVVFKVDK